MDPNRFNSFDKGEYEITMFRNTFNKNLRILSGLLEGIKCDNRVHALEKSGVEQWVENNKRYKEYGWYKSLFNALDAALDDDELTVDECTHLIKMCDNYTVKDDEFYVAGALEIQKLLGFLDGISRDYAITEEEFYFLDNWLEENPSLKSRWPYDEINSLMTECINDNTYHNRQQLLQFCISLSVGENIMGLPPVNGGRYQIDPEIIVPGKTFCITGVSEKYSRKSIATHLQTMGGTVKNGISKLVDYLVVCDERSKHWAFTCYGRKVEEAMQLRKKGIPISIVHEFDLYDTLEGMLSKAS